MHELLDLVSDQDEVVGTATREHIYSKNSVNFRTINGFVINDISQLWIPQRHASKEIWPDLLDASVGGHVKSGESYEEALIRETHEELNLDLKQNTYVRLGKLSPTNYNVGSFMMIYLFFYSGTIQFNKEDYSKGTWYDLDELISLLSLSKIGKPDLLPILEWMKPMLQETRRKTHRSSLEKF